MRAVNVPVRSVLLVALSLLFSALNTVESFYPTQKYLSTPSTAKCSMCATDQSLDVKTLLRTMLSSMTSLEEKKSCYQSVIDLRTKGNGQFEEVLDEMLGFCESVKGNPFCARRLPIPIPSFRVKVGSLRRLLQSSTSIKALDADAEENVFEKRRGLLIILGQLVKTDRENTNIRYLEAEARKRSKVTDMAEMLRRTPSGLETPTYSVLESKGTWEVRKYDQFSVCSVNVVKNSQDNAESPADKGGSGAFGSLAGYIFGRNKEANKMAMTTPVVMSGDGSNSKMSFIMPSVYWTDDSLPSAPTPMDDSVQLEKAPMLQYSSPESDVLTAVLWFGGYSDKKETAARKAELMSNIQAEGKYKLVGSVEDSFLMQYNDPFQPPWSRRNEVGVTVQEVKEEVTA